MSLRARKVLVVAAVAVLILLAAASILLVRYWPFTRQAVAGALQETVPGTVQMAAFRRTYFPSPGCVAEGVAITGRGTEGRPMLVLIQRLTVRTGVLDLLRDSIQEVRADGLRVIVPPGIGLNSGGGGGISQSLRRQVSKFVADGTVVEFERRPLADGSSHPLRFVLSRLTLTQHGTDSPIQFHAVLTNPLPPGEITAQGEFGPWRPDEPGATPASGAFRFEHATLDAFRGIAGTLSASGSFSGNLGRMKVQGATQTPDFEVTRVGHRVPLKTQFVAAVDGVNGDTELESLEVRLRDTIISSRVQVKTGPGGKGRMTTIAGSGKGRIQDLLRLFSVDSPPAMSGAIEFRSTAALASGPEPFLKKLAVAAEFTIDGVRFAKASTQQNVDELSARAQGVKLKQATDAALVSGNLKGHVRLQNGVANFSGLTFTAPGATAQLHGAYNLMNERVNMEGALRTEASLSHSATGIKAVLMKPLDPIFKRKSAGASVGVKLAGTYQKPSFGIDLDAHK